MDGITANRRDLLLTPRPAASPAALIGGAEDDPCPGIIAVCGIAPVNCKLLDSSPPRWRPV